MERSSNMSTKKESTIPAAMKNRRGRRWGSAVLGSGYLCNAKLIGKQPSQSEWLEGMAAFDPYLIQNPCSHYHLRCITMEALLTPIQTRNKWGHDNDEAQLLPVMTKRDQPEKTKIPLNSPEDALDILKSKPDHQELERVLRWLKSTVGHHEGFNIKVPGPKASEIIYILIGNITPIYWVTEHDSTVSDQSRSNNLLVYCLSSVAGLGAIVSRLRLLLSQLKAPRGQSNVSGIRKTQPVEILLDLLEAVLGNDGFVLSIWDDIKTWILQPPQKLLQWKEFISLVASGKLLSIASEATATLNNLELSVGAASWVGDGHHYAAWLGSNVQHMLGASAAGDLEGPKMLSQLLRKAFTLGYTGQL